MAGWPPRTAEAEGEFVKWENSWYYFCMGTYILNNDSVADFRLDENLYNVLIRVTSPGVEFSRLKYEASYKDILELRFFDFPDDSSGLYIFNETILDRVLEFFEKHQKCQNMVIQCERGISRSAGIAVGWFLFNDTVSSIYKLYHDDKHLPNRLIVEQFYKRLRRDIGQIDRWEKERRERLMRKR